MLDKKKRKISLLIFMAAAAVFGSGCSRKVLNYQIAECIGTLNQYENNEPVETPKMKAEREQRESEETVEKGRLEVLEQAQQQALSYRYEQAIATIESSEELKDDERAKEAMAEYQKQLDSMYEYDGDIGHLCFTNLVVDTKLAFDEDEYSPVYRQNMITLEEFTNILNTLYESGYVLIDIHTLVQENGDGNDAAMSAKLPKLPQGKKPIIFSVENLDYSSVRNGDGVATRLVLDENGEVAAKYTDDGGHDLIGAYDVIPVLEQFIEEHPDFSFQNARGIISVSGANGVFGYQVEEGKTTDYKENQETVKQIASKLSELITCSILHASSAAVSRSTPRCTSQSVKRICLS